MAIGQGGAYSRALCSGRMVKTLKAIAQNIIPMAEIQFVRGLTETAIPDVRLTRARDGSTGVATFIFENPRALSQDATEDVTGMYMSDEEGEMITRKVNAKFINGKPAALEAYYEMGSAAEWDRFIRFMERYGEENGLGFQKAAE
jgi:photosystem II 13kDa protein